MKRAPSGDMENTDDPPLTARLRRMVPEFGSYTYSTVLLPLTLTPTIRFPSGVRCSLPLNLVTCGTTAVGTPGGDAGAGGTSTGNTCWDSGCVRSKISTVFEVFPVPLPWVAITARPSAPTSTPCGLAGSVTVCITPRPFKSTTLRLELALFVTYSKLPSIDIAADSGVLPTVMLRITACAL